MPSIPSRIQQQPFGTFNPAAPGRRIKPALQAKGPALPQELFVDPNIDVNVKRALNQIQSNVRQALSQVKGSAFAYANIITNWTLTQGSANGVAPNVIDHGLGMPATGYAILSTVGGYVTAHALIAPAPTVNLIQVWTQYTAFAGVSAVTANILVFA